MGFTKYVQIGRVVRINYGQDEGKLATVVDIVNDKRALIDGPTSGVARQVIPIRRLGLTQFHLKDVLRGQRSVLLKKKIEKFGLHDQYAKTAQARKEAVQKKRASLTDFQRFQVMVLRKRRSNLVRQHVRALAKKGGQKEAAKGGKKK